jgi:transposase
MHPRSLFSLAEHLERLSKDGDPLEVLAGTVEFERFRPLLTRGLGYSDDAKGGRPAFDPVAMFKVLVVQAQHNLSDARMEFMIRDRLSWMRFFGFDLGGAMPDENTIRHYRNRLTESGTLEALMQAFEQQLREAGYLAMGGQIVDATLVPAPKQRNTEDEKAAIKAGKSAKQIWRGKPNKAHQEPQATPSGRQRCRCTLDGEDRRQDPLSPRRDATAADRHARVRLQVAHQH